jgi:glutamate--cysteine ligase
VAQSAWAREALLACEPEPAVTQRLLHAAAESLAEQRRREAADTLAFEDFREQYLSPERLLA